jgi:Domain of unknown function (DUF4396)
MSRQLHDHARHEHGPAEHAGESLTIQEEVRSSEGHGAHGTRSLNSLAVSATNHCLAGCVIGEVAGMFIGTALGWGNLPTIALAVGLAYLFGFALTSLPLFRAGLTFAAIVPIALAADTVSITIMEAIDNAFVLLVPGAMEAGLTDVLLWAAIAGGFVIAYPFAFLANRYMIGRGRGHAVVHQYH